MSTPAASRTFRVARALDARSTLGVLIGGRRGPCGRIGADGVWRATNTPDGPATCQVDDRHGEPHRDGGVITVRAWGPGADWVIEHSGALLGLDDDPSTFAPDRDDVVGELHRRHPGIRFCRSLALAEAMVPIIIAQKVPSIAARRSWRSLVRVHGRPAPGPVPGLRLPPTAERLAALPYQDFHRFDIERRRAETLRRVCARAAGIDRLATVEPERAMAALRSIDGVGAWTASRAAQVALGAVDAVIVGDYHFPHAITWLLAGEPRGTDARMLELLAPYAGQRGRAQRLVLRAGRAPRYGPGLPIQSFADR
jgi:3-methyladenine DNA glycosylase/8-oxoguanine DNA glycosylase